MTNVETNIILPDIDDEAPLDSKKIEAIHQAFYTELISESDPREVQTKCVGTVAAVMLFMYNMFGREKGEHMLAEMICNINEGFQEVSNPLASNE